MKCNFADVIYDCGWLQIVRKMELVDVSHVNNIKNAHNRWKTEAEQYYIQVDGKHIAKIEPENIQILIKAISAILSENEFLQALLDTKTSTHDTTQETTQETPIVAEHIADDFPHF